MSEGIGFGGWWLVKGRRRDERVSTPSPSITKSNQNASHFYTVSPRLQFSSGNWMVRTFLLLLVLCCSPPSLILFLLLLYSASLTPQDRFVNDNFVQSSLHCFHQPNLCFCRQVNKSVCYSIPLTFPINYLIFYLVSDHIIL